MKVSLLAYTAQPEKIIASSARLCYSASDIEHIFDNLTDEKTRDFVSMLASIGHESPIEHVSFTFGIEGVSRSLLAQITRHRIASYSVQSQRYVKENKFSFVMPPEIEEDEEAKKIFQTCMQNAIDSYQKLADILQQKHQAQMIASGIPAPEAQKKAEKMAIEDARYVLPNATATKMIVTMNARSLLHFFRLRCCNRAQWEIRNLANEMLALVYEIAPTIFQNAGPSCVDGKCPEGSKSCGQAVCVQSFYQDLKKKTEKNQ